MDFIRNLITLIQRLQTIVRDGQKRGTFPAWRCLWCAS